MINDHPTHTRYWVIVFTASLAAITYIDRIAIAQAAPFITRELRLTSIQMGYVLGAFEWSYCLFEVPAGWLGDRTGPKSALTRIVIFWSVFTSATAWAWNFASLMVTRFLFGAGQAGCFPNIAKALAAWLPSGEHARAQGIIWMSARWGGALAPCAVVLMVQHFTWRRAFEAFGALGIIWSVLFSRWYVDSPTRTPALTPPNERSCRAQERWHPEPLASRG